MKLLRLNGLVLFFFMLFIALLAWITYGTLNETIAMLSYILIGLMNLYPWVIPFIGIPLGILDVISIFGPGMYNSTLTISHLTSSWLSLTWYWVVTIISSIIGVIFTLIILGRIFGLRHRKNKVKSNYALVNCNIIDGNKSSEIIEDGIILIENVVNNGSESKGDMEEPGKIVGVGVRGDLKIPEGYEEIDLGGKYVLPGLINAHCHLTGSGKPTKIVKLNDKWMERLVKVLDTSLGKILLKTMMKSNATNALNAGVTTLKTMSDPNYMDLQVRDEINEGKYLGPRLLCAGKGICITGGHGGVMAYIADSVPEIRKAIRRNLRERVDFIKILSTGGVMDARKVGEAGRPQMTIEEIESACTEAHRGNLLVATHCESTKGIEEALAGGVDSIEHGAPITDNLIPLFKNNPKSLRGYTYLIPTISAGMGMSSLPKEITEVTDETKQNAVIIEKGMIEGLRTAYKEGIRFGVGTDASVPYSLHYNVWRELHYFTKYTEMSNQEAIYYGTKNNAELLGIDDITGSIEVGKFADLQVVRENPLENIEALSKVDHVFIKGRYIKNPKVKKAKGIKEVIPIEV